MSVDPTAAAGAVAAAAAGVGGAAYLARGVWRASRAVHRLADGLLGDGKRPGVVDRVEALDRRLDGLGWRMTRMEGRMDRVEHQLSPNSGQSLHDKVTAVAEAIIDRPE